MQRGNLIMLNNILNRINMKINLIFISILLFMQMSVLSCGYYQLHSKSIKVTHDEILFQKNDIIINRSPRFHGSAIASPSKKYYAIIESESVLEDTGKIVFYNSNGNEIKTIHLTKG